MSGRKWNVSVLHEIRREKVSVFTDIFSKRDEFRPAFLFCEIRIGQIVFSILFAGYLAKI
jgi:hypothetical protein